MVFYWLATRLLRGFLFFQSLFLVCLSMTSSQVLGAKKGGGRATAKSIHDNSVWSSHLFLCITRSWQWTLYIDQRDFILVYILAYFPFLHVCHTPPKKMSTTPKAPSGTPPVAVPPSMTTPHPTPTQSQVTGGTPYFFFLRRRPRWRHQLARHKQSANDWSIPL